MKNTVLDKKETNKRRWSLHYWLSNLDDTGDIIVKTVVFRADNPDEVFKKTLRILKNSAKRTLRQKHYMLIIMPKDPLPGKKIITTEELFQLKNKYYITKAILKIKQKNLKEYFVQGYGSEALKQLEEK